MIHYRFDSVFSIREIALLSVPKVRSDVICEVSCLNVDNFPHESLSKVYYMVSSMQVVDRILRVVPGT